MKNQYDSVVSTKYTNLVKADPAKLYVQYPGALRLLGDVTEKKVLDVGCGSGMFDLLLQKQGAIVTGYDLSSNQIDVAREVCKEGNFFVASPETISFRNSFDKAVSVLVLHYSIDLEELKSFFSSTYRALKVNGIFVCVLTNPNFIGYEKIQYNRRYTKTEKKVVADFINLKGNIDFSVEYQFYSQRDYEQAAIERGFKRFEWRELDIDPVGIVEMGTEYWQGFREDCPYIGFIAYK